MNLEFRDPIYLLACLAAGPMLLLLRQSVGRVTFSSSRLLPRHASSLRARLAWVPSALLVLSFIVMGVALAGPRTPHGEATIKREGIAIMMVLDRSGSMRALDLSDNDKGIERTRLDAVKVVFEDFVEGNTAEQEENGPPATSLEGRRDDTIGIVSFARYADSNCPLTLDHHNLLDIADDIAIVDERPEDGTAIGDALGLAIERLGDAKTASRVIILLTDGVQNAGTDTPQDAARVAATLGIRIYTIGAGTNGFAPVRAPDPFTGRDVLRRVQVEIDEQTLEEVADITGGRYFRATDAESLARIYGEIDQLEKAPIEEIRALEYHEYFPLTTALALGLAAAGWLLGASVLRRFP